MRDDLFARLDRIEMGDIPDYERHLMVGTSTLGLTLVEGKGVRVRDIRGRWYLDCTAQSWALYLGHAHPEVAAAIAEQAKRLTHVDQSFHTRQRYALAKRLADLAPGTLNKVSFTVGGGPAIEAAMKACLKQTPAAQNFVCLWDAFHGTTLGTMGASWISTKARGEYAGGSSFLALTRQWVRAPNPYCYRCYFGLKPESCGSRCAEFLKLTIEKGVNGPAAGVFIEPIQGSAGQIPCPKEYLAAVRRICDELSVPLVFDEMQTFLRIGSTFAAEHFGVSPDIIAVGKGLGGGLPLAAIILSEDMAGFRPTAEELHTFANSAIAQAAALKMLDVIERDEVLANTRRVGAFLCKELRAMQGEFPEIGDVRGVGLHIGVEFVADPDSKRPLPKETREIRREALRRGAIFGIGGVRPNVLKIKPPLVISQAEAEEALDALRGAMRAVLRA